LIRIITYVTLVVLIVIWGFWQGSFNLLSSELANFIVIPSAPITLLVYLLLGKPCSMLIGRLLERFTDKTTLADQEGLKQAGRLIGYLERWLILTFILTAQYSGIGFLLAAKSIFRFGDLSQPHQRQLTEYMLLGTLLSFFFAIMLGLAAKSLLF
jgi:hypothetical protein